MKNSNLNAIAVVLVVAIAAFLIGYYATPKTGAKQPVYITVQPTAFASATLLPISTPLVQEGETKLMIVHLPAVDKQNQGVLTDLNIEMRSGDGKVYIDFSGGAPLLGSETQNSILNAVEVAKAVSGQSLEKVNLYYSFATDAQVVGGGSAGAATAVATAALISGKHIRKGFIMTGSVDPEGNIGVVGRVLEKAEAAKAGGFTTFLVPRSEATTQVPIEKCTSKQTENALIESCNTVYEDRKVQDLAGIKIIEVDTVDQAYALMAQ